MYDIGIPEIVCTERLEDENHISIRYEAEAVVRPELCGNPKCEHPVKPHFHSKKDNLIRDVRSEGKLVFINLAVKRYRCPSCGNIMSDKFTFYNMHGHITNRLREEFVRRCINGETFSYIAKDYQVDHKTVASAFKAYADSHKELLENNYTPEILGIDEAHIDDHYRLVLTDIKEQRLLDMKKDNYVPTVKKYLRGLDSAVCKCATMDFAPGYANSVHAILPDAKVVIDKFHVVQELNRCVDSVRKDIQNNLRKQGVDIRRFKHSRKLFMANFEELSPDAERTMSQWFTEFPELYEAYMVKEIFRDIYKHYKARTDAEKTFDEWLTIIPNFKQFSAMKNTFSNRKQDILNYWDFQWTNAYTESVNNAIKKIEKAGRGYKFEVLRELCLLGINKPQIDKFNPKTAVYLPVLPKEITFVAEESVEYKAERNIYSLGCDFSLCIGTDYHKPFQIYIETHRNPFDSFQKRMTAYRDAMMRWNKEKARD